MAVQGISNDLTWIEKKGGGEWIMHFFPFFLVIEYRPKQPLPFIGSLKGAVCTMRELKEWGSLQEAQEGMIEWAMDYTLELYNNLAKLHEQCSVRS